MADEQYQWQAFEGSAVALEICAQRRNVRERERLCETETKSEREQKGCEKVGTIESVKQRQRGDGRQRQRCRGRELDR